MHGIIIQIFSHAYVIFWYLSVTINVELVLNNNNLLMKKCNDIDYKM
jgi:hypothetical protein